MKKRAGGKTAAGTLKNIAAKRNKTKDGGNQREKKVSFPGRRKEGKNVLVLVTPLPVHSGHEKSPIFGASLVPGTGVEPVLPP